MLTNLIACQSKGNPSDSVGSGGSPDLNEETTMDAVGPTGEEPPAPLKLLAFSSPNAPASLPSSTAGIEGVFIADFENPDDYFQATASGGSLDVTLNRDGSVKRFGNQYCSRAEIDACSSTTAGLKIYARTGQNLSMQSDFYVKNRPDMRDYTGVMLYVDTTNVVSPNSTYISDPNDTKKYTAVSVNLILSSSADTALLPENYTDSVESFFSYFNQTARTVEAYYYDSAAGAWVRSANAFASKHVILVPENYTGYVYVPFASYYNSKQTSTSMVDYFEEGYCYTAKMCVHTGGYNKTEPTNAYISIDDIAFVRSAGSNPRTDYEKEDTENVVRVDDPNAPTATVSFVLKQSGAGANKSYEYSVGKTIYSSDIPKTPNVGNFAFNCWTSDERGLIPCNPKDYVITGDVTFYGHWFDNTYSYATSATEIEMRDGGVYSLPKGKVIFYGASNFTRWTTLEADMKPDIDALNHGIGGATDLILLHHLDRLVLRYEPSAVVIQCSNNDVVKYTDEQCKQTKEQLYNRIHEALPNTKIIFVSHMPLPNRTEYWKTSNRLQDLNVWVKSFCESHNNCEYLDVFDAILEIANVYLSGNPSAYFDATNHFNAAGQAKFCAALKPEILRIMAAQ